MCKMQGGMQSKVLGAAWCGVSKVQCMASIDEHLNNGGLLQERLARIV